MKTQTTASKLKNTESADNQLIEISTFIFTDKKHEKAIHFPHFPFRIL